MASPSRISIVLMNCIVVSMPCLPVPSKRIRIAIRLRCRRSAPELPRRRCQGSRKSAHQRRDPLLAAVDGLESPGRRRWCGTDLRVADRQQVVELVLVPGPVAALDDLGVGALLGHDPKLSRPRTLTRPADPSD